MEKRITCLVVGNYCHDVLMKDDVVLAESLGGAAAFISAVLDGISISSWFVSKVGCDFAYSVTHTPLVANDSKTTVFHAYFSSQIQRQDRVLKRVRACEHISAADLPVRQRFEYGLVVGVGGEILPETLERMLDICDKVLVDLQALIRVFDPVDGTVSLVNLRDSPFNYLLPRIHFLKASSDEAPYIDVNEVKKNSCIVITNGKDGCTIYYEDMEKQIAPFPIVQVDPTGAGDSFLGGLVVGLAEGLSVPDAALLGNFFGSLTAGQVGLPKFDSRVLQAVKDALQKKKPNSDRTQKINDNIVYCEPLQFFVKPVHHEEFRLALAKAKTVPAFPVQESQQELPSSPRMVEHHKNISCSDQPKLFSTNREEPITSADRIP